jgi:ubiquinone/menaquinone biosynthesis C-methylase UbiE
VSSAGYASSFGEQWRRWATTQLDSVNGTDIFRRRFERYFGGLERLRGLEVLDAGCGAGAFLDVVAPYAARVVGVDLSESVESAHTSMRSHPGVDVVQADLLQLPFPEESFDFVYCIGVIQHTADPETAFKSLARMVRPGGTLAVWIYERTPYERLKPRHLVRGYTAGMDPERAMPFVQRYCRVARPTRRFLRRLPGGRQLSRLVPVSDVSAYPGPVAERLTPEQVDEWEVMDTYDMLITTYEQPQRPDDVARWFADAGMTAHRTEGAEDVAMLGTKPRGRAGLARG